MIIQTGRSAVILRIVSNNPKRRLNSPPQPRRGGCADREKAAKPPKPAQTGGADQENDLVDQHHPSRRYRVGFPLLG